MEILILILLVIILVAAEIIIYNVFGSRYIHYGVSLDKTEVYEGETVEFVEEVVNEKRLPVPWLKTEICTSKWLEFYGTSSENSDELRFVPSIFALGSFSKCRRVWKVKCLKRGVYTFENTSMSGMDLFGLVHFSGRTGEKVSLIVLPTPLDTEDLLSTEQLSGDIFVRRFICPDPFFVSGAREYTGSEPLKSVSWSATARENRLMVRNYDFTASCRLLILLNTERSEERSGVPVHKNKLEILIKAAAAAVEQAETSGAQWALLSNDGKTALSVSGGYSHKEDSLRALAAVEGGCEETLLRTLKQLDTEQYTDLLVISDQIGQKYAEALTELDRVINVRAAALTNSGGYYGCCCISGGKELFHE